MNKGEKEKNENERGINVNFFSQKFPSFYWFWGPFPEFIFISIFFGGYEKEEKNLKKS